MRLSGLVQLVVVLQQIGHLLTDCCIFAGIRGHKDPTIFLVGILMISFSFEIPKIVSKFLHA